MKPASRTWLFYSLVRLGIFFALLGVLAFLGISLWLSAIVAAVIALCLSYIFLRKPREEIAKNLYEAKHGDEHSLPASAQPKTSSGSDEEQEDSAYEQKP